MFVHYKSIVLSNDKIKQLTMLRLTPETYIKEILSNIFEILQLNLLVLAISHENTTTNRY